MTPDRDTDLQILVRNIFCLTLDSTYLPMGSRYCDIEHIAVEYCTLATLDRPVGLECH